MPVSRVNILSVRLLLMNICFICNFKDGIKQNCSKLVSSLTMCLLPNNPHFIVSVLESIDLSRHLIFHRFDHFFFTPDCSLLIDFPALVIPCLSELPIVNNNALALFGSPFFVVKLLLLFGLPLHPFKDLLLAAIGFHFLAGLHLIDNHLSSSSLALFTLCIPNNFLVLGSQPSRGESHGWTVSDRSLLESSSEWVCRQARALIGWHGRESLALKRVLHGWVVSKAHRNCPFSVLLLYKGINTVVDLKTSLKLIDSFIDLFSGLVNLFEG